MLYMKKNGFQIVQKNGSELIYFHISWFGEKILNIYMKERDRIVWRLYKRGNGNYTTEQDVTRI